MLRIYAGRMVAIALMACAGSAAADGPPAAATPAPPTRQALYDSAQAAYDAGNWDAAISGFSQVLVGAKSGSRSTGVIRSRLARAFLSRGSLDNAQAAATQAIADIRQAAIGPDADLADAFLTLGDALRFKLELEPAVIAYDQARTLATGPGAPAVILSADVGVILSDMVTHPDVSARTADVLIADRPAFDALSESDRALIFTLRARAELNRGDADKAIDFAVKALALSGNVRSGRVNLRKVTVRADAGLISAVHHDEEGMHKYFAYSGAGHINDDWFSGASTDLPVCGPDIAPDDTAVIEFSIGEDGRTMGAAPIYASRPGQMGVIFARAVRSWHWRTETVARLSPFWRAAIRLQLRCVTTPAAIELEEPFRAATMDWWRALRDGRKADPNSVLTPETGQVDTLMDKLMSHYTPLYARRQAETALRPLFDAVGAPPEVRAYALVITLPPSERSLQRGTASDRAHALEAAAPRFDAMKGGDRSAAWLRTEQAIALEYSGAFSEARPPLERVIALPASSLAADDPVRRVAILHLSLLDRAAGHEDAARARLTSAGLTGDQCSLLDVRPVPLNTKISDDAFPDEAMRWHFEGWVREAFDVGSDGGVKRVRTVMAYPPYVFGPAAERVVAHFQFTPPAIGDKVLGCAGQTLNLHYRIPD